MVLWQPVSDAKAWAAQVFAGLCTEVRQDLQGENYLQQLQTIFLDVEIDYFQSNVEGEIINKLQEAGFKADGIIINPGGYTHTSVAIGDAIAAIISPVVEVHISNIHSREEFRKISHISAKAKGTIAGLGLKGYELALMYLLDHVKR